MQQEAALYGITGTCQIRSYLFDPRLAQCMYDSPVFDPKLPV